VEGSCDSGNGHSGPINCWDIREVLIGWRLLKKGSAPRVSSVTTETTQRQKVGCLTNE
jgi:hypothetical protein